MKTKIIMVVFIVCFIAIESAQPQSGNQLNPQIKKETIAQLSVMLKDYVFPEAGTTVSNTLNQKLEEGKYDHIKDFNEFAREVTDDMFEISNDKHLLIRYDPDYISEIKNEGALSGSEKIKNEIRKKERESKDNFGFEKIRIYPGNIGYLKLNEFEKSDYAKETAFAAMAFLSSADAIIIDLRDNNGGWSSLWQILCSYFFEFQDTKKNILLSETHIPYKNEIIQYRVLPNLPGKRLVETPVYILTSKWTYSAAEIFAYTLQQSGRAKLIGETTRGGANGTRGPEALNDYYIVKMPVSRCINPVSHTNWEGIGIEPDIKADSQNVLDTVLKMILPDIIQKNPDEYLLNKTGYLFLNDHKIDLAIYLFKENVRLHPESANTYDSLAEAYMLHGNKELAMKNYKKSLEINPDNQNAKTMIKKLEKN